MYYSECRLIPLDTTFNYTSECYLSPNPRIQQFLEEAWFWGVRVGFGGREGALANALIRMYSGIDASAVNCVLYLIVCRSR